MVKYNYDNLSKSDIRKISIEVDSNLNRLFDAEDKLKVTIIKCLNQLGILEANKQKKCGGGASVDNKLKRLFPMAEQIFDTLNTAINKNNMRKKDGYEPMKLVMEYHKRKHYSQMILVTLYRALNATTNTIKSFETITNSIEEINDMFYKHFFGSSNITDLIQLANDNIITTKGLIPKIKKETLNSSAESIRIDNMVKDVNDRFEAIKKKAETVGAKVYYVKCKEADKIMSYNFMEKARDIDIRIGELNTILDKSTGLSSFISIEIGTAEIFNEIERFHNKLKVEDIRSYKDLIKSMEYTDKVVRLDEKILYLNEFKLDIAKLYKSIVFDTKQIDEGISLLLKQETDYKQAFR